MKDPSSIEKLVIHNVMLSMGLVPLESENLNVAKVLKQLPVDEARRFKRKFRKAWRRLARREAKIRVSPMITSWKFGTSAGPVNARPSKAQKLNRKRAVRQWIMRDYVDPTIDNLRTHGKER